MNILLAGVGGQGLVLATEIIAKAALYSGHDVKTSDVVGLSQRGGYVFGSVRYGSKVHSPLIPKGKVDILVGLEKLEAFRWIDHLSDQSSVIVNNLEIYPNLVLIEKEKYPESIAQSIGARFSLDMIDGFGIAKAIGNPKLLNSVLIGRLSSYLNDISDESFIKSIGESVPPKTIELNIKAFMEGKKME